MTSLSPNCTIAISRLDSLPRCVRIFLSLIFLSVRARRVSACLIARKSSPGVLKVLRCAEVGFERGLEPLRWSSKNIRPTRMYARNG